MDGSDVVGLAEAEAWVAAHASIVGHLELAQAEPWASVFRGRTDAGIVWLKACSPRHVFEVPLTAALSARWPATVVEVIDVDIDRRLLLTADAGEPLRDLGNPPDRWAEVLPAYAQLQIGETRLAAEHLDAGVPDLRLTRLPERFEELLAADLPVSSTEAAALAAFRQPFADLCAELESGAIRDSVQHDDLHMNNVYLKDRSLRVLDWGDASISHPFFSLFETFRFLGSVNGLDPSDPWFGRLRDAYLEPWGPGLEEVFSLALRLAGLAHAIAWLDQRNVLLERERTAFDTGFAEILRIGLGSASLRR